MFLTTNSHWENIDPFNWQKVIIGKYQHRSLLLKSLSQAQEKIIIVCPWLTRHSLDNNLIQEFKNTLNRKVKIHIGWGWQQDIGNIIIPGNGCWELKPANTWKYNAMSELQKLKQFYPEHFQMKLIGTHAKVWVCDYKFAVVTSANILCSKLGNTDNCHEEIGIWTNNINSIQNLINSFAQAPNLAAKKIS
ncbi:MAG: phospholipase D-like domain-containing protein [Microcoleaceae cyanobacterium]